MSVPTLEQIANLLTSEDGWPIGCDALRDHGLDLVADRIATLQNDTSEIGDVTLKIWVNAIRHKTPFYSFSDDDTAEDSAGLAIAQWNQYIGTEPRIDR